MCFLSSAGNNPGSDQFQFSCIKLRKVGAVSNGLHQNPACVWVTGGDHWTVFIACHQTGISGEIQSCLPAGSMADPATVDQDVTDNKTVGQIFRICGHLCWRRSWVGRRQEFQDGFPQCRGIKTSIFPANAVAGAVGAE